jgi:hypothetical protein
VPVVVYSVLRLALFAGATGLLWWAGMRSWLAPLLAAFLAWALSYVLLNRQRDGAARWLAERAEQRRAHGGRTAHQLADDAAEDAEAERAARGAVHERPDGPPPPTA